MNACAPNVVLPLTAFTGGELRVSKVGDLSAGHDFPAARDVALAGSACGRRSLCILVV